MSLVGTRPPTVDEWKQYEPYHRGRLAVKPGLTGMWQVSGRSDITDFEEVVKLDMEYVKNWDIGMDIKILFKTVGVVLKGSGSKADLIYSLNAGDVHWCVNAKGIKGVSCPSKYYGLASAARPVIGVLESGSEIRCIIEDTKGGLCCEPGEYDKVEENLRWFIDNAGSEELKAMGARGRENLEKNLTRNVSVRKYAEEILKL